MTLKTRNSLLLTLFFLSLSFALFYTGAFIFACMNDALIPPENPVRYFELLTRHSFFSYSFDISLYGIAVFIAYVPLNAYIIWNGFEKTQSTEVIYFTLFLLACLTEGVRLLLPMFGLWKSYTAFFHFVGRCVFAGRILAPFSLLFAALCSETDQRQSVDRNCALLILGSVLFAILVPLDTSTVTSTCTIWWGYRKLFVIIRVFIYLATFITIIVNAVKKDSHELKTNAAGFAILILGYSLLQASDNLAFLITSFSLFIIGNIVYLKSIHSLYMWS